MQSALDEVGRITDAELVWRLERLVKGDRALSAKLLVHLGEVEARGVHRERSFSSMFDYCRSGLRMSEAEAHLRILAARVGRRFPLVLERLAAGDVHLTAIKLLAPLLTAENHGELLERVRGMTKRKIEVLVADLAPKPDAPARIRKLPAPRRSLAPNAASASSAACSPTGTSATPSSTGPASVQPTAAPPMAAPVSTAMTQSRSTVTSTALAVCGTALAATVPASSSPLLTAASLANTQLSADAVSNASSAEFALQSPQPRASSTPLGLGRFKLQLTLGQESHAALEQLVELFRHQNPSGDLTFIVERALFELLKSKLKQRFGQTSRPQSRTSRERVGAEAKRESPDIESSSENKVASSNSRYIPAAVRRELHARDAGQCTFVSDDGRRCTERGFIEVHHHNTTFARGGKATADNLRLACRVHNRFFAERDYGRALVEEKLRDAKEQKRRTPRGSESRP